jgi:hypothetical protein
MLLQGILTRHFVSGLETAEAVANIQSSQENVLLAICRPEPECTENRRRKADLLLEFEDAKERMADLNDAAQERKDRLDEVSKWLGESRYFEHSSYLHHFEDVDERNTASITAPKQSIDPML